MRTLRPTVWVAAAALSGATACSRGNQQQMDNELKRDLAAVHSAPSAQLVISPLEAGLSAAPKARERSAQPTPRPAKRVATVRPPAPSRAPAPAPAPIEAAGEVARSAPSPVVEPPPLPPSPKPTPARTEEGRRGPYKTEAEIFRQFPNIRP